MRTDFLLRLDDYIVNAADDLSQDTLVLANKEGSVAALPIRNRLIVLLWSPNSPMQRIKRDIENLVLSGYPGPYMSCRLVSAVGMIRYYIDEPGYLVLRDAPVSYIGTGTRIGAVTADQLPYEECIP